MLAGYAASAYRGVDQVTPIDVTATSTSGAAATTATATNITTVTNQAWVVGGAAANGSTATFVTAWTTPTGTERNDIQNGQASGSGKSGTLSDSNAGFSVGTTATITWTISASLAWDAWLTAIRPAATVASESPLLAKPPWGVPIPLGPFSLSQFRARWPIVPDVVPPKIVLDATFIPSLHGIPLPFGPFGQSQFNPRLPSPPSEIIRNVTAQLLTGTLSFTGNLTKQVNKDLPATLSFTGALTKTVLKSIGAALSFNGALTKILQSIVFNATLSFTGNLAKRANKDLAGTLTFTGLLARQPQKSIPATLGFTGNLSKIVLRGSNNADLSFAGNLTKTVKKFFTASIAFNGSLTGTQVPVTPPDDNQTSKWFRQYKKRRGRT